TPQAVYAFFHLLVAGSLIGFVAYNWLLGQVSATLAGTYAYINPIIAVLVGWLLNGETITVWVAGGMAVILAGVGLVRCGGVPGLDHVERQTTFGCLVPQTRRTQDQDGSMNGESGANFGYAAGEEPGMLILQEFLEADGELFLIQFSGSITLQLTVESPGQAR